MDKEQGTVRTARSIFTGTTATLAVIALGALAITACGDVDLSKKGPAVAGKTDSGAVSGSTCVSCHTDEERLKMETAGIKAPPKSAMTSGKG